MGDLAPRSGGPPSRRSREQRAYRLVMTGGVATAVAVVGTVLAVIGVLGWWLPVLAVVVAAICGLLFRRTVS
jgi:putative flippase GtrA